MKLHVILAALVLAAPASSFSHPKGPKPPKGFIFPGVPGHVRHAPAPVVYHRSYYPRHSCYYSPYLYAPLPYFSFSYVSSRPVYRSTRSYATVQPSVELDVQRALRQRGYYQGALDGDIGPQSRAAIRSFQADSGLPANGVIDSSLLQALGL
jgi:hypothetical protein